MPYRNANIATLLTGAYFPKIKFFDDNNINSLTYYILDIDQYIDKIDGTYSLNLDRMSRSDRFRHLFHTNFHDIWNVDQAWEKYGTPDVIAFCVDYENDQFFVIFSRLPNAANANVKKETVREMFLNELYNESGKSATGRRSNKVKIWDLDFSTLVYKNPHNICNAFCDYAYRKYTLMSWGIDKLDLSIAHSVEKYLKAGGELRDEIVGREIPKMTGKERRFQSELYERNNYHKPTRSKIEADWMADRSEFAERILEQVPEGTSKYAPKASDVFVRQLKGGIYYFRYKESHDVNSKKPYKRTEITSIDNCMTKLRQYITNENDRMEFYRLQLEGTYFEKVVFLYEQTLKPLICEKFEKKQLNRIQYWYMKQSNLRSLDEEYTDDEEGDFSLHTLVKDPNNLNPEDNLVMAAPFKYIFGEKLDETMLDKLLECLPTHFDNNPPYHSKDAFKRFFHVSDHSRKKLYNTFFEYTGSMLTAMPDEQFKDLIEKVEHIINKENVTPEKLNRWTDYFKNAFENEFKNNANKLKEFLECLSNHLIDFPFEFNSEEKFVMEHNHKEKLYLEYCKIAGINGDRVIKEHFNDNLIESVIEKITENVTPEILGQWTDCFRIVFKEKINEPKLTEFITFISDYFKDYPLKADYNGKLYIGSTHLEKLYGVYCKKKGKKSEKIKHDFVNLVENAFDKIDELKNGSGSMP